MSAAITGTNGSSNTQNTAAATTAATSKLANEDTFLKLLVAQMQNQDPLNPVDSTQFVTQLAQYSSLEQLVGIKQDADKLIGSASTATNPAAATKT